MAWWLKGGGGRGAPTSVQVLRHTTGYNNNLTKATHSEKLQPPTDYKQCCI